MSEGSRDGRETVLGEPVRDHRAKRPEMRERNSLRYRLRPLLPASDASALHVVSHDSPEARSVWAYMAYGPFADQGEMRNWLEACARSRDPMFLAVVDTTTHRAIGMVSFMRIDIAHRSIELGNIWYAPAHQGGRANPEVIHLMLCEAFEELGFRRVEWKCDSLNASSRRAALRLGFTFEGIFRKHYIIKGRNRDTAWYSIIDSEWPGIRAAYEHWLRPENFAPNGNQLTKLAAWPG